MKNHAFDVIDLFLLQSLGLFTRELLKLMNVYVHFYNKLAKNAENFSFFKRRITVLKLGFEAFIGHSVDKVVAEILRHSGQEEKIARNQFGFNTTLYSVLLLLGFWCSFLIFFSLGFSPGHNFALCYS